MDSNSSKSNRGYQNQIARKKKKVLENVDRTLEAVLKVDDIDLEIKNANVDVDALFEQLFQGFTESLNHPNGSSPHPIQELAPSVKADIEAQHRRRQRSKLNKNEPLTTEDDIERVRGLLEAKDFPAIKRELELRPRVTVGALYFLLEKRLHGYLYSCIHQDKIDDYVQHAFIRLIETLGRHNGWHGEGSLEVWLRRVAKYAYIEHQRTKEYSFSDFRPISEDGGDDSTEFTMFDESFSNEDDAENLMGGASTDYCTQASLEDSIDIRNALQRAIPKLNNEQRPIFLLLQEGYKIEEISKILNITQSRANRVHASIIELVKKEIGEDEDQVD